jgi:hypothetical protein
MMHNILDVKEKNINMAFTIVLTRRAFVGISEIFPTHFEDCIFVSVS